MRKDRNSSASSRRFTLPKSKILRGRINFQRLFEDTAIVFKSENISIRFQLYSGDKQDCKMAFIVPKRLGKAVKRNRMKRLLKESYRLNQYIITDEIASRSVIFHGAFTAKSVDLSYEEVRSEVKQLMKRVQDHLHNNP